MKLIAFCKMINLVKDKNTKLIKGDNQCKQKISHIIKPYNRKLSFKMKKYLINQFLQRYLKQDKITYQKAEKKIRSNINRQMSLKV